MIYFHGKQRCLTCKAIEKIAKEVVNNQFANELENGTVVFNIVDISTPVSYTHLRAHETGT